MARAYYLKGIYLAELAHRSPENEKEAYLDDVDIFRILIINK